MLRNLFGEPGRRLHEQSITAFGCKKFAYPRADFWRTPAITLLFSDVLVQTYACFQMDTLAMIPEVAFSQRSLNMCTLSHEFL